MSIDGHVTGTHMVIGNYYIFLILIIIFNTKTDEKMCLSPERKSNN